MYHKIFIIAGISALVPRAINALPASTFAERAPILGTSPPYFVLQAFEDSVECNGDPIFVIPNVGYGQCFIAPDNTRWGSLRVYETGAQKDLKACRVTSYTDDQCETGARQSEHINLFQGTCSPAADNAVGIATMGAMSARISCD